MGPEPRTVRVDGLKMRRLRLQAALTLEDFEDKSGLDRNLVRKLFRGQKVSLWTLERAAKVFEIKNHLELLHPDELAALGIDPEVSVPTKHVLEWEIQGHLSAWERTENGLQFCVARLQHRIFETRLARGKCYWLQHLQVSERQRLEDHLRRHCEVCERVGKHPAIAENFTATFLQDGGLWWVIDEWVEGPTLAECLKDGPLDIGRLKKVMTGVAEGLAVLHNENVIRRELSPRFIIVRRKDQSAVLIDFELAKLLDGKTVRPKGGWLEDPYRATEVAGDAPIDGRADVYSWGRIFVEAATGSLPAKGDESDHVKALTIPDTMKRLVLQCVARTRSKRPQGMAEILQTLKRWKPL